jgi:hypothetical protein
MNFRGKVFDETDGNPTPARQPKPRISKKEANESFKQLLEVATQGQLSVLPPPSPDEAKAIADFYYNPQDKDGAPARKAALAAAMINDPPGRGQTAAAAHHLDVVRSILPRLEAFNLDETARLIEGLLGDARKLQTRRLDNDRTKPLQEVGDNACHGAISE